MNFKKSYDSGTLKSKFSTRNASLACSGSLFLKLSSNWGGFSNLIKMLQYAAVSALGSCHQNFFESSTDQAREPKTAVKVLEENPRSWSIAWGHLSNATKNDEGKVASCGDPRASRAFRRWWAGELTAHGTQPCWRQHKFTRCPKPIAHTHVQDWQQQSCLASCLQSLDKLRELALCRSVFSYMMDIYNSTPMYFLRQEYILNPCFASWLIRSKQPADFLELSTSATSFVFKLSTMLSKTFQNYVKNKTTTQANKKPNRD